MTLLPQKNWVGLSSIKALISAASISPFKDIVFRFHNPVWAFAPTSGKGAEITGGRFNPKGTPAFYTALEQQTAFAEVSGGTSRKIIDPMLLCAYKVNLERVIDLSMHEEVFSDSWRLMNAQSKHSMGQKLAIYNRKRDAFDAALVPSYAHPNHTNLVIYKWTVKTVKLYDPEKRLPELFREKYVK